MFKIQEIREIIRLVDESAMQEFVFENDDTKLLMKKGGVVSKDSITTVQEEPFILNSSTSLIEEKEDAVNETTQVTDDRIYKVLSPMVGTFYSKPSPEANSFVQVGEKVKEKDVVCILEAMKLFNEIEAEVNGEILEILIEDGQLVEYGEPLFLIKQE
ncbi:acetyl-CoA carboxylase biotin carboxyl carrier protein [Metabacillus litoralis]|uniref:acetyl-CoA carboxylase biotin carboxyl carrier protein n=1 Tax=Metabacillus litoralis TaxID=152268 RepID=UPI00203F20B5|nr:acetyl-CoA carboxylase biotin carboxyl carrier protein [Metabacillus litoralis]MCM3160763.1 acetyl-CoA carboxylase biotin carboxyl carrier protein [Metabacillus litoralis]